ncbi:MAG: hypothetical protein AAGD96_19845 [Chloroflexota bacterium]
MQIVGYVILGALVVGLLVFLWRVVPAPSRLLINQRSEPYFPETSGSNLLRQAYSIPADLEGELNIIFVAFLQNQQPIVNTWVPFAQEAEAQFAQVAYYEFPTLDGGSAVFRTFLNEGMRAGIPDPVSRERTITLYIDLDQFLQATDTPNINNMHTLLINKDGEILWRTTGRFTQEKGSELTGVLESMSQQ